MPGGDATATDLTEFSPDWTRSLAQRRAQTGTILSNSRFPFPLGWPVLPTPLPISMSQGLSLSTATTTAPATDSSSPAARRASSRPLSTLWPERSLSTTYLIISALSFSPLNPNAPGRSENTCALLYEATAFHLLLLRVCVNIFFKTSLKALQATAVLRVF